MKFFGLLILLITSFSSIGQILVENPSKDLGDIYENKGKVTSVFVLKNPYKEDTIRIHNIITSCGCTAILSDDTLIMPMSSIELKFAYDPAGRAGLFTKSIEVISRIGIYDQHRLFLKITGNVVAENSLIREVNAELVEYLVAPLNFYAITAYDTSYLDFNFFISFVNDLSYEIDFFQFTTLGFKIGVDNYEHIEQLEFLVRFIERKIQREFILRGYSYNTIFFENPIFVDEKLPEWATASVKVYSTNFGSDLVQNSVIRITEDELVDDGNLMLSYERFSRPSEEDVLKQINFDGLEGKLFLNSRLDLQGIIMAPKRMSYNDRKKYAAKLEKTIFKQLKKSSGINKDVVTISFDSLMHHPKDKFKLVLWDKADEEHQQKYSYEIQADNITPPLLPTFKQSTVLSTSINQNSDEFKFFWKNIMLNHKSGAEIKLVIESSKSKIPRNGETDLLLLARQDGNRVKEMLQKKFSEATGRNLNVVVEPYVHGPEYNWYNKRHTDYAQYEYVNIIPVVHVNGGENERLPKPYMVNFDYFFNGIDTASWVFNKFANYIAEEIEREGYVHLIMESSISQVPIEKKKTNVFLAYERALESQKRIKASLQYKLIDPNRIIFSEERFLVSGPAYDGKIPIVKFRKFQYLKVIPEKYLTK